MCGNNPPGNMSYVFNKQYEGTNSRLSRSFWGILSLVTWALEASYNSTTDETPTQLVFGHGMMLNLSAYENWKILSTYKKQI